MSGPSICIHLAQKCDYSSQKTQFIVPQLVKVVREGRRGRPRKWIDPNWLIEAVDPRRRLTKQTLASCLGVDKKTLKRIMEEFGLSIDYSRVTEQRLHELAGQFKIMRPSQGYRMFEAWLFAMGICLPIHQIRKAMDPVDRALRKPGQRKGRGAYEVEGSNTLWHLDGHHKLIRWRFVIHGIIDGFDRTVSSFPPCTRNCK